MGKTEKASRRRAPAAASNSGCIVLCAVAGAIVPLSFAPFYWWWLAPLCYAALFVTWRGATPRQAFARGWVFGCSQFLVGVYWITISVHEIAQAPIWVALALMLGLVSVMAVYPALVGWVAARWISMDGSRYWLGTLPALMVLAEWFRGWAFTGFGWLAPGYSQTESWLLGYAPLVGVLGVSWAVFLVAGALASAWSGDRRAGMAAAAIVVAVFSGGLLAERVAWTEQKPDEISVALAQGAVPQELKWLPEQLASTLDLYRGLTLQSLGADLIIWPEAAIPDYYDNYVRWLGDVERLAADAGSRVMLGMLRFHPDGYENAVFTLGQPESTYVKRHLVPYGEYFPMPDFVRPWVASMNLLFPNTQPGADDQPPISLLGERIAITICYEDVFGAEQLHSFPEASLLVNVSNDAWFGDSLAPHQHLQIARFRSAEVRRWQLRTTNTGITAVIDPYGRVSSQIAQFEPGVLRTSVVGVTGSTPYIAWGNFAVVLLAIAVAVLAGYPAMTKLTIRPGT